MTRREFTCKITLLIQEMIMAGDQPIVDYALRSAEEQKRLFDAGLSECDGVVKLSAHQRGKAMDLYLWDVDKQEVDWDWLMPGKAIRWHDRWVELGGKPAIIWDQPHYEG